LRPRLSLLNKKRGNGEYLRGSGDLREEREERKTLKKASSGVEVRKQIWKTLAIRATIPRRDIEWRPTKFKLRPLSPQGKWERSGLQP